MKYIFVRVTNTNSSSVSSIDLMREETSFFSFASELKSSSERLVLDYFLETLTAYLLSTVMLKL
ncbi:MAG TPA: hypothetical protein VEP90_16400 [Methylomirabilota bacterium]|nr:hypothetical protein [Methylomirabilota bacterium]